jgi:hypothetical protein
MNVHLKHGILLERYAPRDIDRWQDMSGHHQPFVVSQPQQISYLQVQYLYPLCFPSLTRKA